MLPKLLRILIAVGFVLSALATIPMATLAFLNGQLHFGSYYIEFSEPGPLYAAIFEVFGITTILLYILLRLTTYDRTNH